MIKNKKGQGIAFDTIIYATIGIIILLVIIAIVTDSAGDFWTLSNDCAAKGGDWKIGAAGAKECVNERGTVVLSVEEKDAKGNDVKKYCCVIPGGK